MNYHGLQQMRKFTDFCCTAYGQLVLAVEKLAALIRRMQGRGAKQQSRLARQINLLIRKFGGRLACPDRSPFLIRRMQGRGAKQQSRLARQINLLVKKFGGR